MKILILEDDQLVADGLVRGFGYLGCRALHVSDVREAQAQVQKDPDIRLALIDIGLDNGQSGEAFFSWVRDQYPRISRVLISGLGRPAGFVDDPPHQLFLRKPFGQAELARMLETVQPTKAKGDHS